MFCCTVVAMAMWPPMTKRRLLLVPLSILVMSTQAQTGQHGAPVHAQSEPGAAGLSIAATPEDLVLDGVGHKPVWIVITNTGAVTATSIDLVVSAPVGATWTTDAASAVTMLEGGSSHMVEGALGGRLLTGGTTSIVVTGMAGDRPIVATDTIDHGAAPALGILSVVGGTKLTNEHDLDLVATIHNTADSVLTAQVSAFTSDREDRIDAPTLSATEITVAPGFRGNVDITIGGDKLPTADEVVTVSAVLTVGGASADLAATHAFSTAPFGDDSLASTLGLASLLLIPGLAATSTWSMIRSERRRQRGVVSARMPDVKDLGTLVAIVVLSAATIEVYRRITGESLYNGYNAATLTAASIGAALVAAVAGSVRWWRVSVRYPVFDELTSPEKVLQRLDSWELPKAEIEGKTGRVLWAYDGAACIIAGLKVTRADRELADAATVKDLKRLKKIATSVRATVSTEPLTGELTDTALTGAVPAGFRPIGRAAVVKHTVA